MFAALKKWWKYLGARLGVAFDTHADPKVQLEQAIAEAKDQHRRLTEQAATVIANAKRTEIQLTRATETVEKLTRNATQAVLMADEAAARGDTAKAAELTDAAEAFANQLIAAEGEVTRLESMATAAASAAEQAKAAVANNSRVLQRKLAERAELLSRLDQAKMAEQMNSAMESISGTVGADVATLDEVRAKIERRHAVAAGHAELAGASVDSKMLEVEQAAAGHAATARLSEIRSRLGISDDTAATGGGQSGDAGAPEGRTATQ